MSISYNSVTAVHLRLYCNNQLMGPATGFFFQISGFKYLVSNWHVFSGRNTYTGKSEHSSLAVPDEIEIWFHSQKLGEYFNGFRIPLYKANGKARWIQHQEGQRFDIGAIRLRNLNPKYNVYPVNHENSCNDVAIVVASEVFILGFPLGLTKQGPLPVWKRGTIASEPEIMPDDKTPTILVDTATREGMSGAPVYAGSANGSYLTHDGNSAMANGPIF